MIMSKEKRPPAASTPQRGSVIIIDHDIEQSRRLADYLSQEGFEAKVEHSPADGIETIRSGEHAIVILDVVTRGMNGLEVLRQIRNDSDVPVLVLTERGDDVDRIIGLELGADDYLAKPFNPRELLARVRAILRRSARSVEAPAPAASVIQLGDVEMDVARRHTMLGGKAVTLTGLEFELLRVFLLSAGNVLTRQDIAREVFHRPMLAMDRTLSVHVCSLRRKLGHAPRGGERIKTVHGVGYIYLPPSDLA